MTDLPAFSIIVATYRREWVLCETLGHLLNLSYGNFEILVIDQTSIHEPETEQCLRVYARDFPGRFRVLRLTWANLPNARNVGAMRATGDYLLYCDDDIIPPDDLIQRHLSNLRQAKVGAATGGIRVEAPPGPVHDSPCVMLPNGRVFGYWNQNVRKGTSDSLLGCNMSVSRKLAYRIGLFDTGYIGSATWEEVDFSVRVRRHGYTIAYDPAAAVVHLAHGTGGARASKEASDVRYYYEGHHNNAYFFAKNVRQRYLPSFLKRELGWILVKQPLVHRHAGRTVASMHGLWDGYRAGRRVRNKGRA